MSTFTGFVGLRTPADLLAKLQHDIHRMIASPESEYAAFDFFVTAEHIVDWLHPDDKLARTNLRKSDPLLQIASHIANGAKHFEAKADHHSSVRSLKMERYLDSACKEPGVEERAIVIKLTAHETTKLGSASFEAIILAYRLLEFWRTHLGR